MSDHLAKYDLHDPLQSAYRAGHCTETALIKVLNDIRSGVDNVDVALLILLDLSSAFDTIDHNILLKRLNLEFGIRGTALDWVRSYLTDRSHTVVINDTSSAPVELECGVPQGSVLGPILFTLSDRPLGNINHKHNLQHHLYADDNQLYRLHSTAAATTTTETSNCCRDIKIWMTNNKLKLNGDKTETILIGPSSRRRKCGMDSICVDGLTIPLSSSVKDLGVVIDSDLTLENR